MTPIGKRRLLKLADILDTADAKHREKGEPTYDQFKFVHDCGTPACALAHWAANNRRRLEIDEVGNVRSRSSRSNDFCVVAYEEFDLDERQAHELFGSYGCGEARTAKQAARYIRKFVKRIEREEAAARKEAA